MLGKLDGITKLFGPDYWSVEELKYGNYESSFKPCYNNSLKIINEAIANAKNS